MKKRSMISSALIMSYLLVLLGLSAQPKKETESVKVLEQTNLQLQFDFADRITFTTWEKDEVFVEVDVEINAGRDNDIFSLKTEMTPTTIRISMDRDLWNSIPSKNRKDCQWSTTLNYTVYLPSSLEVHANTISGDFELEYFEAPIYLKTISGSIDIKIPPGSGMDFRAETISGEMFSDLDIKFLDGKEGLRQVVGQKINGRINDGGYQSRLKTISGNIYLRKG
ncbi:MAG: DUF4097 family beta strand repeat-containing protein [Bacteroidota bacterium]